MKKIALVGTSNSIMKDGYGQFLQELLPGQVDSLGLGGCSSINAVFSLLKYDIVDKYEYVVFDFCINDFSFEKAKSINKFLLISYWSFIFNVLRRSKTTPVLLLLPNMHYCRDIVDFYIAISDFFNIEYVDISFLFSSIPRENLFRDSMGHYCVEYQKQISRAILDVMNRQKRDIRYVPLMEDIEFSLSKCKLSDVQKEVSTAIRKMQCYEINTQNSPDIVFPQDGRYISGMLFWSNGPEGKQCDPVYICNDSTVMRKNFNLSFKGFFAREVANGVPGGVKNPVISFKPQPVSLVEPTRHQEEIQKERLNHIFYVNSVLFCNVPPVAWGEQFYQRYRDAFERERERERETQCPAKPQTLVSLLRSCLAPFSWASARQAYVIRRSGLFDTGWYLERYPDVAEAGIDPVWHYVRRGAKEGRDPAPWFSTSAYEQTNSDVAASGMNPFYHYIRYGLCEGRRGV